jgi:uncharacterized protein YbjT (DUF2867 family)
MSIVINTPSGNIGRAIAEQLLEAGESVTVISRNPDKVADLVERGARLVEGSIDDAAVLDAALAGADSLFWLTPPPSRPDYFEWAAAAAQSAADAAVRHGARAVVLSSVGAQSGPGTGPVAAVSRAEDIFRAALDDVAALRPGFFMENLLRDVGTIATMGAIYSPIPADKSQPMVATADIAAVAADTLADRSWSGHRVVGIHGPADLSNNEIAAALSEALGRDVAYVEVTVDAAREAMAQMNMPQFLIDIYAEMYEAIRDGRMDSSEPRTPETTTPTTLAAFAREVIAPAVAKLAA